MCIFCPFILDIINFIAGTACADLIDELKSDNFGKTIWKQLQPLLEGKIPYAPNTLAINDVIKLVSKGIYVPCS